MVRRPLELARLDIDDRALRFRRQIFREQDMVDA
jgi:hypothetical protein